MGFLQTAFLWALPLALLPVVIHLLNRLRYRTVKWAAMMFLLKADRTSTRRERLRNILILAARCMALLLFLFAMSRPLVGGWLGGRAGSRPDVVVMLLDRSASMETLDPRTRTARRQHALTLFAQTAEQLSGVRFVLIDSATLEPREVPRPDVLEGLAETAGSDTAGDMPALLRAAADFLLASPTGRAEVWIASDLQAGDWRPESPEWGSVVSRFQALSGGVNFRVLALTGGGEQDRAVRVGLKASLGLVPAADGISLSLRVSRSESLEESLPVVQVVGEARTQFEALVVGRDYRFDRAVPPAPESEGGTWGWFALPADDNVANNRAFFVAGARSARSILVVAPESPSRRLLELASVPVAGERVVKVAEPASFTAPQLDGVALVMWQAPAPAEETLAALSQFVREGGQMVLLPPGETAEASGGLFDLSWGAVETPTPAAAGIETWEEEDGPLARMSDGQSLPLSQLVIMRRRVPLWEEADATGWVAVAQMGDTSAFLARRTIGRGAVWAMASLPARDWSTLAQGPVLVPMLLRIIEEGGRRHDPVRSEDCGFWRPSNALEWVRVDSEDGGNPLFNAGIYRHGERLVAVNRPAIEDEPTRATPEQVTASLAGLPVEILEDLMDRSPASHRRSEFWRPFIFAALLFMIAESLLLLSSSRPPTGTSRRTSVPLTEDKAA